MPTTLRAWSLMTKTRKGVVSVLRDLTLDECRRIYHRLNPDYGHTYTSYENENGSGSVSFGGRHVSDNEMDIREVFGPPDWNSSEVRDWDKPWPKLLSIKLDDPRHFTKWALQPARLRVRK